MSLTRNWSDWKNLQNDSQLEIHKMGWQSITVMRDNDNNRNVGVTAELDTESMQFYIKARIDPLESREATRRWLGLVEPHILPMVKKGDRWFVDTPNSEIDIYRVESIYADEIILERIS